MSRFIVLGETSTKVTTTFTLLLGIGRGLCRTSTTAGRRKFFKNLSASLLSTTARVAGADDITRDVMCSWLVTLLFVISMTSCLFRLVSCVLLSGISIAKSKYKI